MNGKIRLESRASAKLPDADRRDAVRFCPKCGREIPLDRRACAFCENTGAVPRPIRSRKEKILISVIIFGVMLLLLFGLDLAIRIAGPLKTPVPTLIPTSAVRGTSLPVILLP